MEDQKNQNVVEGVVKFYSISKGYGFFVSDRGQEGDVFIHFSVLDLANVRFLKTGDRITCEVIHGPRGFNASKLLAVEHSSAPLHVSGPSKKVKGTMKWYNRIKGFGFVLSPEYGEDIFVHASLLQEMEHANIAPGTNVCVDVVSGPRGLEAVSFNLNEGINNRVPQ